MNTTIKQARSGIASENLQEVLDAAVSAAHATDGGQQQYETPPWLAAGLVSQLVADCPSFVFDPQCASGNLLEAVAYAESYGWDIDNRFAEQRDRGINRVTGNCVKLSEILDEIYPDLRFPCIVTNPPYAIRWKQADGTTIDSTLWTWQFIKRRLAPRGSGFLISSWSTIERMGLHTDPWCYLYQKFPAGIWPNTTVEIGVVHFYNYDGAEAPFTRKDVVWESMPNEGDFLDACNRFSATRPHFSIRPNEEWNNLAEAYKDEIGRRPKWNIYLDHKQGMLRTYLSTKAKIKFDRSDVLRLTRIDNCHPLTLTTERDSRKILAELLARGIYQIEPKAEAAIKDALKQVESLACPVMPITDFELVAYTDEEDELRCLHTDPSGVIVLTVGKSYPLTTGSYTFKEKFSRKKLHFDEETEKTELKQHDCELSGSDRFVQIIDDRGAKHRFMERPNPNARSEYYCEHNESLLWKLFAEPYVRTVAETNEEQYERNVETMRLYSMINGFKYFDGQLDYYARMGCKDYGVVGADVGCHAAGTEIMLADGRTKVVEEVAVGDYLMGWDNTPRRVLRLARGRQEMARIVPVKGEPFVVNMDHILTLFDARVAGISYRNLLRLSRWHTRDITVREYLAMPHSERCMWILFKGKIGNWLTAVEHTGFTVELLPEDNFYGFAIEGDGRFLLGDFTVTHNTGKTLGALTMVALKGAGRSLIIAPQGTMRSSEDEEGEEYRASQWVQEIQRFASSEPVFQLFSEEDLEAILRANGNKLPNGIYITYPQAYFSNGAFEFIPQAWEYEEEHEEKFCKRTGLPYDEDRTPENQFCRGIGAHDKDTGIRCVASPSLATKIACRFGEPWDLVILDEGHLICNENAQITRNLIRLQPKYRFIMTATPIPNIVTNLFTLMGWCCVPDWYLGNRRNAAWPYAVDESHRFASTFLSHEVDVTAQSEARAAGKRGWRNVGVKVSPIISSPARLLKLLKPSMAYISKEKCNPNLQPCEVIDVRVDMGAQQSKLYQKWVNRASYVHEYKHPLVIARVQSSRLRGICAAPVGLDYNHYTDIAPDGSSRGASVRSNFNPKTSTILELAHQCLAKGEQVVIVSSRVGLSDAVARRLAEAKIEIARIDNTVPADMHTAEANRFKKGDARVMIMGIKCAQGHSFDQCPNLIIGALEWSYGTLHQAKGRVWRLTSKKPVKVWIVLIKGSIEELLFDRVATKQDAATLCLHGRRVPRDFKTLDAGEVLAEHIVEYAPGKLVDENTLEDDWAELRRRLELVSCAHRA